MALSVKAKANPVIGALSRTRILLARSALVLLIAGKAVAQFTSSVQGTVQDPNGGAIAEAEVTLVNEATKVSQRATTDSNGVYHFVSLAPGGYRITAMAKGFSAANVDFTLQTSENRNVLVTLAVGQVSTNVEVTSQTPLLDTSDSRNALPRGFPLPGRDENEASDFVKWISTTLPAGSS